MEHASRTLSRRSFLRGLAGVAGASVLAACRSTATPPPPSPVASPTSAAAQPATATATVDTAAAGTPARPTATAAPVAAPASPAPGRATPADRVLPLFDTHVHYSEDAWGVVPIDQALRLMDQAGTRLALVSSTPDAGTIALHQADLRRVIPVLRPYRTRGDMASWFEDPSIPPYLEERLALGVHRGIGEFHLYGEGAATPVVAQIVRLAVGRGLFLHAHSDQRAVEGLFAVDPAARVLWAHAGFAGPAAVRAMVERYPNLSVEFAFRADVASGGRLDPGWREVLEAHPARFMVGTDSYTTGRWTAMPAILGEVRAWCASLPPELGDNLAWRNAARLLGVDEAVFRES